MAWFLSELLRQVGWFATSNIYESESVGALTSQNVILKNGRGQHSKYLPYAFTEQGVAMLRSFITIKYFECKFAHFMKMV